MPGIAPPTIPRPPASMNGQQRLADYYSQQAGQGVGFTQARNQALFNAQAQAPGYGQSSLTPINQSAMSPMMQGQPQTYFGQPRPMQNGFGGGGGGGSQAPGFGNVLPGQGPNLFGMSPFNQPSPMYSPELMQKSQNQVFGSHVRSADLPSIMKQLDRPGVSQDEGTLNSAANIAAGRMSDAGMARAQIGLDDTLANNQHMLRSQVGQQREMTDLARIFQGLQSSIGQYDLSNLQSAAGLLGRLGSMGSYMG